MWNERLLWHRQFLLLCFVQIIDQILVFYSTIWNYSNFNWYCNRINSTWVLFVNRFQKLTFEYLYLYIWMYEMYAYEMKTQLLNCADRNEAWEQCLGDWVYKRVKLEMRCTEYKIDVPFQWEQFLNGTSTEKIYWLSFYSQAHNTYTLYVMKPIELVCE